MLRTLDGFTMEGYVIGAYILLMECVNEKSRQLYASQFRSLQVRVPSLAPVHLYASDAFSSPIIAMPHSAGLWFDGNSSGCLSLQHMEGTLSGSR